MKRRRRPVPFPVICYEANQLLEDTVLRAKEIAKLQRQWLPKHVANKKNPTE